MVRLLRHALATMLMVCSASAATAQGIEVKSDADVLFGSTENCTQPAEVEFKKVRDKTPEWKTIKSEGVEPDSARYEILVEKMNSRIKRVCKAVAKSEARDCVVKSKDVVDANGLDVADLTDKVVKKLESDDERS